MNIKKLIKYIVCSATENESALTSVRLVKFMYLADLYYARTHKGKTLTGLHWAFVHYGPYCSEAWEEIEDAVSDQTVNRKAYESKFPDREEFYLYTCLDQEGEKIWAELPIEVIGPLKLAIKKYGDDTAALLDHVYFETEPMINAKPGDILDFSTAKLPEKPKMVETKKLPEEKVKLAREYTRRLGEKAQADMAKLREESKKTAKWRDEIYYRTLEVIDGEDLEPGLKGKAKIVK
jgi:hypothetical protein